MKALSIRQPVRERPILFSAPMVRALLDAANSIDREVTGVRVEGLQDISEAERAQSAPQATKRGSTCRHPIASTSGRTGPRFNASGSPSTAWLLGCQPMGVGRRVPEELVSGGIGRGGAATPAVSVNVPFAGTDSPRLCSNHSRLGGT
jgi:hypothetical protein